MKSFSWASGSRVWDTEASKDSLRDAVKGKIFPKRNFQFLYVLNGEETTNVVNIFWRKFFQRLWWAILFPLSVRKYDWMGLFLLVHRNLSSVLNWCCARKSWKQTEHFSKILCFGKLHGLSLRVTAKLSSLKWRIKLFCLLSYMSK